MNDTDATTLSLYTLETEINGMGYTVELIASSERFAISRTRGTLFHSLKDWAAMEAEYVVTDVRPYVRSES